MLDKILKKGNVKSIKIKFHKKYRSKAPPVTKADKKLSKKHLKESIHFNESHAKEHEKAADKDRKQLKHIKSYRGKRLSSVKAKKILKDKEVRGHPLTRQQQKFFGAIAGGQRPYAEAKARLAYAMRGGK